MRADELAPKPGPDGNPEPPEAPIWRTPFKRKWGGSPPKKMPTPPEGRGPVLYYYNQSSRRTVWNGVFAGLFVFIIPEVFARLPILEYVGQIWPLIVGVVVAALFIVIGSETTFFVGSDWMKKGRYWVDTYELTKIYVGGKPDAGRTFSLTDSKGHRVDFDADTVCSNPKMWNLVYNGMAHSVANGAIVKGAGADFVLKLDKFKPK